MENKFPFSSLFAPEDIKHIDHAGRRILERVGIKIHCRFSLDMLEKSGVRIDHNAQIARFEPAWLNETLAQAPSQFVLYSRDGVNDVHMGTGRVNFSNGGRVFRILDMGTGGYRLTMLRDVANTAALVNQLDNIRLYIISCQAHDIEPPYYHLNSFYYALNHTTKHVMGGCDNLEGVKQMWELAGFVAGGKEKLRQKPFVSVITNPISPLTFGYDTLDILKFCCENGIPVTCAPASISGTTAPATLAGTLSQMHAEALAGVAMAQVYAPGARVLYGAVPSTMDLRNMEYTMGSVEMALMNAAAVKLAKLYHLPIYASAGVTEAKRPDIQAGCEKSLSSLMVAMSGADLIHLAAGMLDSGNSISYEQYVIDNEIIGMIYRILSGIRVSTETLGSDVIEEVGPGGNYVMADHTVEHMMEEFFYPDLAVRCNFDIWEQRGRPNMLSRAKERVEKILKENIDGLLDPELISGIKVRFPEIQNI
ncbi:MAG: trimethylamine methyltransferase family protein [Deltaproteobacteria bacterium]|nr:trimethylamine methyltransferase family protein [Deltaproteobacteria bacterium]MBW2680102.1 trimethylamine methyltransferase family protein [Deltaproteobacteria bacterium]